MSFTCDSSMILKEKLDASYSYRLVSYPKGSGNTQSWSGHATESS